MICINYQSILVGAEWKVLHKQDLNVQFDITEQVFKRQNERENEIDEQTALDLLWEAGQDFQIQKVKISFLLSNVTPQ